MNIAIIDNIVDDRQQLANYIRRYCTQNHIIADLTAYEGGEAFLADAAQSYFDIVFLDIYLRGLSGMETATELRRRNLDSLLVFVTGSRSHAVQSFRIRAFDYLVKPYGYPQFAEVMRLCDRALMKQPRYIEIKEGRVQTRVLLNDIIYTDYYNHYIQIHTKSRIVKTLLPFKEFAPLLLVYPQFICCYRNCIVNMDAVDALEEKDFLLQNGERIPLAKKQLHELRREYFDYVFAQLDGGR